MSFKDRSITIRFPVLAALAALAVLALLVLIGGSTARATLSDGDVVLGAAPNNVCTPGTDVNCANSVTAVKNMTSGGHAFEGFSDSGIGVRGFTTSGTGVFGDSSSSGTGVRGVSSGFHGVEGDSSGDAVFGQSTGGNGVLGLSFGAGKAGVKGDAGSNSGIGVLATNGGNGGATALKATGKTSFSRSGKLTVTAGTSSATKSPINLTSNSMVFATIQGNQAGVYVQGVTQVTGTSGSFTIHLSKNTTANLPVAWFIVN